MEVGYFSLAENKYVTVCAWWGSPSRDVEGRSDTEVLLQRKFYDIRALLQKK